MYITSSSSATITHMAATLTFCPVCPSGKRENKRIGRKERRMYHKLLRRIGKAITVREYQDS